MVLGLPGVESLCRGAPLGQLTWPLWAMAVLDGEQVGKVGRSLPESSDQVLSRALGSSVVSLAWTIILNTHLLLLLTSSCIHSMSPSQDALCDG